MTRKRVLFIIFSIYGGGAEKQMQQLLSHLDRAKVEPHLAVFQITGKEENVVPAGIPVYDLSTNLRPASVFLVIKLTKLIKKIQPDKILSFLWSVNIITLISAWILRISDRVIISERTYLELSVLRYRFAPLRNLVIRVCYPKAGKIIAVSRSVSRNLAEKYKIPPEKISVIYNGVDITEIEKKKKVISSPFCKKPYIVAIGGLRPEKNFSLLIKSFSIVAKQRSEINLLILGEGSDRANLEVLTGALNLSNKVYLPGRVTNPFPYLSEAEIFVLSSKYEGFPNVIVEAMACRVPVVAAADSDSGITEILTDGQTGLLVDKSNDTVMAAAIAKLLVDKSLCKLLIENAYNRVLSAFSIEKTMESYKNLLQ